MGQENTGPIDEQKRAEGKVLLVKPKDTASANVLPPYERQADEVYVHCMQRIRVVPPLLKSSIGLPLEPQSTGPRSLNNLQQFISSLTTSQLSLMEQEAVRLQQQREADVVLGTNEDRSLECAKTPLGRKLKEFVASWQSLQTNAAEKIVLGAREIDTALFRVNESVDILLAQAEEQNILGELYEFAGRETHALHEEVAAVTTLLQNDVLVLLNEIWPLLSDVERAGINTNMNAMAN